jgi:hypothetical protein
VADDGVVCVGGVVKFVDVLLWAAASDEFATSIAAKRICLMRASVC